MLRCFGWGIKGKLLVGGRGSIKGQYEPVNCHSISQAIKLHSAIFCVQDDWILTYIAIISCSSVNEWSHASLLNPSVEKEQVQRSWVCSEPRDPASCLGERCTLHINCFSSVWQRVVSPSWQPAFAWKWNKLGVLKVSCSAMAPNPVVQPIPQQSYCFVALQYCVAPLG